MKSLVKILQLSAIAYSCQSKPSSSNCDVTFDKVISPYTERMIFTSETDSSQEIRDVGADTIIGGYYTFRNGLLESYYFFTGQELNYTPHPEDEILENDESDPTSTFCSYAEIYDTTGRLKRSVDIPLVYRLIKRAGPDSVSVKANFFSLNKEYKKIQVTTNTNYSAEIKLVDDTVYSNMKAGTFQFDFKRSADIRIYINGSWTENCSPGIKTFQDTILLKFENGVIKTNQAESR